MKLFKSQSSLNKLFIAGILVYTAYFSFVFSSPEFGAAVKPPAKYTGEVTSMEAEKAHCKIRPNLVSRVLEKKCYDDSYSIVVGEHTYDVSYYDYNNLELGNKITVVYMNTVIKIIKSEE